MKHVMIVLADGFEEIEALGTADILRRMHVEVTLAGLDGLHVISSHGMHVVCDAMFDKVLPETFDAVILPGGLPGAINLYDHEELIKLLQAYAAQGKVTAAICAAPLALDKAGLLAGKRWTMYPSEMLFRYLSDDKRPLADLVAVDGKIITGKGPGATAPFAKAIATALDVPEKDIEATYSGMFF